MPCRVSARDLRNFSPKNTRRLHGSARAAHLGASHGEIQSVRSRKAEDARAGSFEGPPSSTRSPLEQSAEWKTEWKCRSMEKQLEGRLMSARRETNGLCGKITRQITQKGSPLKLERLEGGPAFDLSPINSSICILKRSSLKIVDATTSTRRRKVDPGNVFCADSPSLSRYGARSKGYSATGRSEKRTCGETRRPRDARQTKLGARPPYHARPT